MGRVWTCRNPKCKKVNKRTTQLCSCGTRRPKARVPEHRKVLAELPYEWWVETFGERCGICGREPTANRRLDRDHCHRTGRPRGLACARCNRALQNWVTPEWLESAAEYLRRCA